MYTTAPARPPPQKPYPMPDNRQITVCAPSTPRRESRFRSGTREHRDFREQRIAAQPTYGNVVGTLRNTILRQEPRILCNLVAEPLVGLFQAKKERIPKEGHELPRHNRLEDRTRTGVRTIHMVDNAPSCKVEGEYGKETRIEIPTSAYGPGTRKWWTRKREPTKRPSYRPSLSSRVWRQICGRSARCSGPLS